MGKTLEEILREHGVELEADEEISDETINELLSGGKGGDEDGE